MRIYNAMETNEEEKILVKIKISLKTSWLNETRVVRQREIYIQRKTKLSRVLILPINFWKWIPHIYFVLLIKDQNKNSNSIKWLTKIISNPSIKGNLFCLLNTWKQLHSIIIISCDLFMMSSWKIKRKKKRFSFIYLHLFAILWKSFVYCIILQGVLIRKKLGKINLAIWSGWDWDWANIIINMENGERRELKLDFHLKVNFPFRSFSIILLTLRSFSFKIYSRHLVASSIDLFLPFQLDSP